MQRTLLPLVLIVLVLLGAWMIWPQAEPRAPANPSPDATETLPVRPAAGDAEVEAVPAAERAPETTAPVPAAAATILSVQCVSRTDKRPLAGVHVRATGIGEQVTAGNGCTFLEVQPGRALAVSADDFEHFVSLETAEVPALAAGETRQLRLEHDVGEHAHFCGLVVARDGGAPVAGTEVRVGEDLRTSTDAQGRFEIDYASFRAPPIRLDAPGFGPAAVGAGPGHENAEHARRIELGRAASLVVALQVPEGQTAVRVALSAKAYEISQDQAFTTDTFDTQPLRWEAQADAQWVCTLGELPPGVSLDADALGTSGVLFHSAEPIVLKAGEQRRVEWDLRGCELLGHVYEADGTPAREVTLWLLRAQPGLRAYVFSWDTSDVVGRSTSAADGSYRFPSVSPGTWRLAAQPVDVPFGFTPADAIAPVPIEVTIRSGEPRSVVDLHLVRGLYIRGTLVAPDGVTGMQGDVSGQAPGGEFTVARADAQGVFALGPLGPGTFSLEGRPSSAYLSSLAVAADAGARDVVLRSRPGAEVAGRVVDGQSGAGVLAAITIGGEDGSTTMTRTQPDGNFRLDGLAPGRYTLFAATSSGQAGELGGVLLDPGAPLTGLQVVLKPGAKLRIRYEGSGIGQVLVHRGRATIGGDGVEAGRSTLQVVPAGKLAVEFRYPGVEVPEVQELELSAGEERELVFKAPPAR